MTEAPRPRYPITYRTLPEALLAAPPDQPFVTMWKSEDDVQTVTFGEFVRLALGQAAYLQQRGLRQGDRVILVMPQGIPLMTAFAGALCLGAIPAILAYPNFKVDPAKYRFGLAGVTGNLKARLVVLDDEFPDELLEHVALKDDAQVVHLKAQMPAPPAGFKPLDAAPDSVAFIQHSAGTTGLQKGVALSHAAVLLHLNHLSPALRLTSNDCIYSWLPLYHDMGLIACFMLPMVCHLPIVMQSPTDWVMQPGSMLEIITKYKCTLAWTPNFTLQFLARRVRPADRQDFDLSSLRMLINCSEPVRGSSMDEFRAAYAGCKLQPHVLQASYAMAETVFAVTQSGIGADAGPKRIWVDADAVRKERRAVQVADSTQGAMCFVSSGKCIPGCAVRAVSDSGKPLPEGGIGEILIRSDSLLTGYYNRPDLTEKALQDGWYWSGDLGFALEGEVYVVGRKKDLIIVAGENIYPQDVEEIVSSHPAIHDGRVVAFGAYNPELGTEDIVVAAEVNREEDLAEAARIERELKTAITGELAVVARRIYLKPPKWVVKSTAGKPARSTTREKLIAEHPELQSNAAGPGL
ncbi:MAG: AMP-binding protein [Acidobacteriia bacterium]|nr:AMP-binding protein [Terriglobia bacterium]